MSCLMNFYLKVLYVAVRKWNSFPKIDVEIMLYMLIFKAIDWRQISRVVTKILSCRVNTTSRRGIKWLGICFGSIFLLFSNKSSRGPLS